MRNKIETISQTKFLPQIQIGGRNLLISPIDEVFKEIG